MSKANTWIFLQIDGLCESFYKFYQYKNHKRNSKEGSKDWVDMQTLLDLTVIHQVLF